MWIKVLGVILFGTICLAFLCDLIVLDYAYSSAGRGVEHSIDAGIIKSGIVVDAQNGLVQLNKPALQAAAKAEFIKYMGLTGDMENNIMKNSSYELSLVYDENDVPWIEVKFYTHVSFTIRAVEYPVKVNRKIDFVSVYK
ncbi:hypothetical protein FHR92_002970 [Fontibacillus solani]|uniref:DUF4320 domain-containing protein n=1 Tax=Fontibacillus solani TaxID=1572857 RepID=A0A7W3XS94_9BACL|nr:hypothetical protein [Fontibacillus solani]MBA9086492.1 hypothetical protein [Fontibacillus solani]